jgi:hypothetical protein
MIDAFIARLVAEVPDLEGRIEGAGELAELTGRNALPQHGTSAFVIPLGWVGGKADAGAGAFDQMLEESYGVITVIRNHTPVGRRVLAELKPFLMRIIEAIAGWTPGDTSGVFRFARGSLVSSAKGTLIYQMDFSIADQLRIFP